MENNKINFDFDNIRAVYALKKKILIRSDCAIRYSEEKKVCCGNRIDFIHFVEVGETKRIRHGNWTGRKGITQV